MNERERAAIIFAVSCGVGVASTLAVYKIKSLLTREEKIDASILDDAKKIAEPVIKSLVTE